METEIMDALKVHDVLVLCGETGCGKTTQVRQPLALQVHAIVNYVSEARTANYAAAMHTRRSYTHLCPNMSVGTF
jgi:tRNA A37 threonylcarbamoyladenosine biosynthesis protein TsaE